MHIIIIMHASCIMHDVLYILLLLCMYVCYVLYNILFIIYYNNILYTTTTTKYYSNYLENLNLDLDNNF